MTLSIKDKLFGSKNIDALKFGLAAGMTIGIFVTLATLLALANIQGFTGLCEIIEKFYGPWGYSISPLGILIGGAYGFGDGFIVVFIFALVYNKLLKM